MKLELRSATARIAALWLVFSTVLPACAVTKSVDELAAEAKLIRPPVSGERPADAMLAEFGRMVRAYKGGEFVVEVDLLANDTGIQKELPRDLGHYAVQVIDRMDAGILTTRSYSSLALLDTSYAGKQDDKAPVTRLQTVPEMKLTGALLRYQETVEKGLAARAEGTGTRESDPFDISGQAEGRKLVTNIRVGLNLVARNGVSFPGCAAEFEILHERAEEGYAFDLYHAGTGFGLGSKVVVTQDVGEALRYATAAAIVRILGNALQVPYYRCSPIFTEDETLVRRLRRELASSSAESVRERLRAMLHAEGHAIDLASPSVTPSDRRIIDQELARRGISGADAEAELFLRIWSELDYRAAAPRVDAFVDEQAKARSSAARQPSANAVATSEAPASSVPVRAPDGVPQADVRAAAPIRSYTPPDFGWAADQHVILIDLGRLDALRAQAARDALEALLPPGSVRRDSLESGLLGVLYPHPLETMQRQLRQTIGLEDIDYSWVRRGLPCLVLMYRK